MLSNFLEWTIRNSNIPLQLFNIKETLFNFFFTSLYYSEAILYSYFVKFFVLYPAVGFRYYSRLFITLDEFVAKVTMNYYLWITLCYIIEYSYIILLSSLYVYIIQECIVTLTLHCNLQGVTKLCDQKWVIEHILCSRRDQFTSIILYGGNAPLSRWRPVFLFQYAWPLCGTSWKIFFFVYKKKKKSKDKKNTAELIRYMLQKIFL